MQEPYLTTNEVADILRCHPTFVIRAIDKGQLEAIQIGRDYRISPAALSDYIETVKVKPDTVEAAHEEPAC